MDNHKSFGLTVSRVDLLFKPKKKIVVVCPNQSHNCQKRFDTFVPKLTAKGLPYNNPNNQTLLPNLWFQVLVAVKPVKLL